MAVYQSILMCLTGCYREQARSHRGERCVFLSVQTLHTHDNSPAEAA
ncbi:hypothetical protein SRABI06_05136 [Pseudomonas brassicacearum]|nr:hypothetical protein SRABI06_05136 [Pseudomonas brassicacearum]